MSGMIYIGDNTTERESIDTSQFIRRLNDIDMGGKRIVNLGDPFAEEDAMNLKKFNSEIAEFVARINSDITTKIDTRITDVTPSIESKLRETIITQNAQIARESIQRSFEDKYNFNNQKLTNLLAGTEDTDAVNFKQLKDSTIITDMKNKQIKYLSNGTNISDAVNLNQVNNIVEQKLQQAASRDLDMGGKKIINLQNGIYDQEAATVSKTRNLGGYKITSLARETEPTNAVNFTQISEVMESMNDYVLITDKNYFQENINMNNKKNDCSRRRSFRHRFYKSRAGQRTN